jgi:cytoskeletal protein CcmA (bactofilin family)
MFKNKRTTKIDPDSTDTLIGEGSQFEGKIKSEAGLRIEGRITGDIEVAGDVTIGEHGVANSNIKARNVIVAGQVTGNIAAQGKLTIKATGKLHGNLSAMELSIESGGHFHGSSKMDVLSDAAEEKTVAKENEAVNQVAAGHESNDVLKTW